MQLKANDNLKNKFMRMCIAEAIISMMKTTPFEKLRISAIVAKAGIARMTFYNYYNSPKAALIDYLQIIVGEYMEGSGSDRVTYMSYEHILYSLNFFDKYSDFFMTLVDQGMHSILLDGVNSFMQEHIQTQHRLSIYELYSYSGGLLNTFLKWEESGKADSAEDVAAFLYRLYSKR